MTTLSFYKSRYVNDSDGNGGGLLIDPASYIQDGIRNNLLPDVSQVEVLSGFTRFRKFYLIPDSAITFLRTYLSQPSSAMDNILIHVGTEIDVQSDADDYTSWKGAGTLKEAISAGALSSLIVISENEGTGYNPGDLVYLSEGDNEDFIRIQSVTWSGYEATITPVDNTFIGSDYTTAAYASAVIERGQSNEYAFWFKETIPMDIASYINNLNRINFLHRST